MDKHFKYHSLKKVVINGWTTVSKKWRPDITEKITSCSQITNTVTLQVYLLTSGLRSIDLFWPSGLPSTERLRPSGLSSIECLGPSGLRSTER